VRRGRREDEESDQEDSQNKFKMQEKEVEMIKGQYINGNTIINKKKVIKHGADKFKQVFMFDWDATEDTSTDINPLYAQKHDPKILFGKGFMGGVD
jgi:ATP-dependent RNA helicase DDX23/PRP28